MLSLAKIQLEYRLTISEEKVSITDVVKFTNIILSLSLAAIILLKQSIELKISKNSSNCSWLTYKKASKPLTPVDPG